MNAARCPYCLTPLEPGTTGNLFRCPGCRLPYHRTIVTDPPTWVLFYTAARAATERLERILEDPDQRRLWAAIVFADIIRRTLNP